MTTSTAQTIESPAARRSAALVATLIARSFGLAAGVAIAMLGVAMLWVP